MKKVLIIAGLQLQEMLEKILSQKRCRVALTATGREGLKRMRRFRPDIILLEMGAKEEDGVEIVRRLRSEAGFTGHICLMSANPMLSDELRRLREDNSIQMILLLPFMHPQVTMKMVLDNSRKGECVAREE